jgi:hypothetical protein
MPYQSPPFHPGRILKGSEENVSFQEAAIAPWVQHIPVPKTSYSS